MSRVPNRLGNKVTFLNDLNPLSLNVAAISESSLSDLDMKIKAVFLNPVGKLVDVNSNNGGAF